MYKDRRRQAVYNSAYIKAKRDKTCREPRIRALAAVVAYDATLVETRGVAQNA